MALTHCDFGPNNLPVDRVAFQVTAVVDWGFAHFGGPLEDLSRCEQIVGMHHAKHRQGPDRLFRVYGGRVAGSPGGRVRRLGAVLLPVDAPRSPGPSTRSARCWPL
ncbi:phosphotransferase [Streptomyces sp. NPDC008317]|uniref:phosphotransferase n=1 Tax=Streptomyces sp. NPDC008317 TaxID=3364827 RepID=UPI0036EC16DF